MANNHAIRTGRLTDRQVLDMVNAFKDHMTLKSVSINLGNGVNIDGNSAEMNEEIMQKLSTDRHSILQLHIVTLNDIHVQFYRGTCTNTDAPASDRQASPYFDEVFLIPNERKRTQDSWIHIIECMDVLETSLPRILPVQDAERTQDVVDVLQAELTGLAEQYRKILGNVTEERMEHRKEIEERRRELECQHAEERKSILKKAENAKREFVVSSTQEELRLRQKIDELDQREKALDDRHHMHARRELRQQITDNIKRRIQQPLVSKRTSVLRWTVFGLTLTVGLIMGYYGVLGIGTDIFDILELFGKETFSEFSYIGFSIQRGVLLFLSVGFIAYSINWLRLVYLDDVRMERRYESYSNDIDRASFVIETIMEVGEKKDMEAPEAWIEGVCRNLFSEKGDDSYGKVPSNAAAMLFESIAGARFGPDGTEITMGRKDARRFAKKMGEEK